MSDAKKAFVTFGITILVGAFKAFVLMLMWNWFVSPVFHTADISFWQTLGLLWVVQLFVDSGTNENPSDEMRWERLLAIVTACIPEHKDEIVREELKEIMEGVWWKFGSHISSQLTGYAFMLGLGWVVHTFFVGV